MACFVRRLNKPYRRIDFVMGGMCSIADGIVDIFSFGYVKTGFKLWHTQKTVKRALFYLEKEFSEL